MIYNSHLGIFLSEIQININKKDIIYIHPRKGKKVSEETKRKLSEAKCGENHPCYGKIWIHNSEKCLKIFPEEFENYSNQGFIKGRKYAN